MSKRTIILAILAAALACGAITSGCNRNRDVAVNTRRARQAKTDRSRNRQAQAGRSAKSRQSERGGDDSQLLSMRSGPSGARPAEVLSSTVRRGSTRREPVRSRPPVAPAAAYPVQASEFAYIHVPPPQPVRQPMPQPVETAYQQPHPGLYDAVVQPRYAYSDSVVPYDGYLELPASDAYASAYAVASSDSGYASMSEPVPMAVQTPQLVEAKASLRPPSSSASLRPPASLLPSSSLRPPPPTTPVFAAYIPNAATGDLVVPVIEAQQFAAPIPELEPVRYQQIVAWEQAQQQQQQQLRPPQQPLMMSDAPHQENPAEIKRALAPLPGPVPASQGWVPSPATAMRGTR